MKKFERNKAAVVEVLTELSAAINADTSDDDLKLADELGARSPDARDRRLRVLYIQLACDIINFLHRD